MSNSRRTYRFVLYLLAVLFVVERSDAFVTPMSSTGKISVKSKYVAKPSQVRALAEYSGELVSLFNNMKTPASIIAGALVPLGFMAPLPIDSQDGKEESRFKKALRVLYSVVAITSLASELLAVVWASVASNNLIETVVAPAASVGALIKRDYELEWVATNASFVGGMFGFLFLIGTRMFFHCSGGLLGRSVAGIALSALMLMVAIVNRGIAVGFGKHGLGFGTTVISLWSTYIRTLSKRALNPESIGFLEIGSVAVFLWSVQGVVRALLHRLKSG